MKEKYSLVLEGGGAKGAYQIGAYIALKEKGFEFDHVVGTSIGAINGAVIAQGDVEKGIYFWEHSNLDAFDDDKSNSKKSIEDYLPMIKSNIKNIVNMAHGEGVIDSKPLWDIANELVDEEKLRASEIRFGLCTYNLTDKKTEELFIDQIPEGMARDFVVASAYHPVFKLEPIGGKYYIDGGVTNRIPYSMVEDQKNIIIVRTRPRDFRDLRFPKNAIVIEPGEVITKSMDFDPDKAKRHIHLGYLDAMKVIDGLKGREYYFAPIGEAKADKFLRKVFFGNMKEYEEEKNRALTSEVRYFYEVYVHRLAADLKLDRDFTMEDLLFGLIERELKCLNADKLKIRTLSDATEEIKNSYEKIGSSTMKLLVDGYERQKS